MSVTELEKDEFETIHREKMQELKSHVFSSKKISSFTVNPKENKFTRDYDYDYDYDRL